MAYERVNWENLPSKKTPVNADNLNKLNDAIDQIENDFKNAGAHNSLYRGKDITSLFYDGTLSQQIAAGTFDDIFIGDYIIGKTSKRKYLVADLDYRYGMGFTEITKHHVLMIPDRIMYTARMNATNTTAEAYIGSEMYKTNLASAKSTIQNDFESSHILAHRNRFANVVKDNYE